MAGLKINICFWYVDLSMAEEIIAILREGNYDPNHCLHRDPEEIKEMLEKRETDLIIADFDLPDTLRHTIEKIHKSSSRDVPLIYLVGEKNEHKAAETLKKGVWDYILKSHYAKLIPTVYSSQKFGKVLTESKAVLREKRIQDDLSDLLIQYITDPILIINKDWEILFANSSAARTLGLPMDTVDQLLEKLRSIIFDQHGNPHAELSKVINREVPLSTQQYFVGLLKPDGNKAFGFLQIQLIDSAELHDDLTIITFRDMTALRRVEKELSESESKYLSIFNVVKDGMILIDPDTFQIVENNPRVEDMFGFHKGKSKQDNLEEFASRGHGYDRDALGKAIEKLSDSDPVTYIYLSKTLKGNEFWTENTLARFEVGEKKLIVLVIRDINEQKIMEYNLKESKDHFQNLAENSPDVIMRFDKQYRHLYVNKTIESQVGLEAEKFINKTHKEMGVFPEDKVKLWENGMKTVFDSGKSHTVEFNFDTGDELQFYEWRIFPERGDSGEIDTVLTIARNITAARVADEATKVSEERLQLALQATNLGLWDWNLITDEVYYSPIWLSMLGYDLDDLANDISTWQKLLHEEDAERSSLYLDKIIKNRDKSFELEFRMRCKDGKYKWILSKGRAVQFDVKGSTIRFTGTHEDIAERKRNEVIQSTIFNISNAANTTKNLQELYEKIQEHLSQVVDTTNCFLAIYHEETNTLTLPFLRDEKDSFNEFPAGKTMTAYVLKTGAAQLIDVEKEKELTRLGEIEPVGAPSVSWLGVPLRVNGKIFGVYAIQSYTKDVVYTTDDVHLLEFVSDQIAIAIERKSGQDSIRESQERQRRIFESSPDPIIVVDLKAKITDFNSSLAKELEIKNEQIIGQNIFHFINRRYWRKAIENFDLTWKEGYIKNLEFRVSRANGSAFEAEVATGAIYNQEGEPESMVILIKNIDERKEGERKLLEAKEKAEEADRLKTAFLSNMSHEIRTPMNAIVGFSGLLSDASVSQKDRKEFIAQINLGADNLMHLIDDIIDISKIEAGQIKINIGECYINGLLNEQIVMFRQNLSRHDKSHIDLRLNWNWPSESLNLKTDQFRLKQVITNLLSNAIKFTDAGTIELGIEKKNEIVYFYVRDSGIGIQEEKQSLIFDRFRQGHDTKTKLYGGTGLGLAISRNIIHLLGGKIGVISEPGKGSEFWFTLPADEADAPVSEKKKISRTNTKKWDAKKILVAEDDYSNFMLITEALKSTNVDIIWAKDGKETLELFEKNAGDIHLVLMDIHMPVFDGYHCTREIKKQSPNIPVIAQTAYAMSGEKDLCLEAGCDDYISKPLQVDNLLKMIGSYMK